MKLIKLLTVLGICVFTLPAHARLILNNTYTLLSDPGMPDGYGFSGTITTNNSTGNYSSLGTLPITDWSITLTTPSGVDGVSSQVLNPSNSELSAFFDSGTYITFTSTQIILPDFQASGATEALGFSTPNASSPQEELSFSSAQGGLDGEISISDLSEAIPLSKYAYPNPGGFVIATVPEPASLALLALGCGLALGRRRRRQNQERTHI